MRPAAALAALCLLVPLGGYLGAQQASEQTPADPDAYRALGLEPPLGLDAPKVAEAPAGDPLDGDELDRRTEEVASLMRCPVCQGLSVADSPTDSALAMKGEVREMLAAGYSEEQVLSYFERSYGEFIRLAPKAKGFNLLVWLAPVLGIVAGVLLVVARVRSARRTRPADDARPEVDPDLAPYLERVRREVVS